MRTLEMTVKKPENISNGTTKDIVKNEPKIK